MPQYVNGLRWVAHFWGAIKCLVIFMFSEETSECPQCGKTYDVEWPRDENFRCDCGQESYWSHYTEEDGQPLHFFWRGEEDKSQKITGG